MLRTLVLGRMPLNADPATHVAAGPWCFAGQEDRFPDWEERYTFAPDPLEDPHALDKAAREAQGLATMCIPRFVREIRNASLPPLPEIYWDMVLGCWSIMAAQQVVGYWHRAEAMAEAFGEEEICVSLLPKECPFSFATEQDFVLGGALSHAFPHWLLSRMLEALRPARWEFTYEDLPPEEERIFAPEAVQGIKARLKQMLRQKVKNFLLSLPFPRIRGFAPRHSWTFSRALRKNRNIEDYSRPLATLAAQSPVFPFDPMLLMRMAMPASLRQAKYPRSIDPARRKRLRVGSITAFEDTAYRLRLAEWKARGHKLAFVQHGGNYGMVRTSSMDALMEFSQHAFITWGWNKQSLVEGGVQPGNFVPLPHPLLADARHEERENTLLYVGTEIPVFPYRMDSRLSPLQYVQYRDDKQWFFEALPYTIQEQCRYRPYFSVPGTLADAEWLLPRFPHVRLCSGDLMPQIYGCRLLVLDHHGTTLLQALAADVPVVLFWDRQAWGLCPEADAAVEALAEAGIWHPTAESAAMQVRAVWDDVQRWWHEDKIRAARQQFCAAYARSGEKNWEEQWKAALQKI